MPLRRPAPRAAACLWQSEEGLTCRLAHVLFKVL
jgi:hypothetical protein